MLLKPGTRLRSVTCATRVIVVRAPAGDIDLRCGGAAMTPEGDSEVSQPIDPEFAGGTHLGKRYTDGGGLEVLVTKAGDGTLSVGPDSLSIQDPKRLPSSD